LFDKFKAFGKNLMDENLDETLDLSKIQDFADETDDNTKSNASVQLRSEVPPIGDLPTFSQKRKKASQKRRKQLIAGVMIGLSVVGIGAGAITSLMNNHRTADSVQPVSEKINGDKSDKDKTAKAVLDGSYKNKKKSMEKTEKENKEEEKRKELEKQKEEQEEAKAATEASIQARIDESVNKVQEEATNQVNSLSDANKSLQSENSDLKNKNQSLQQQIDDLTKKLSDAEEKANKAQTAQSTSNSGNRNN
jgi:PREDICTED: hypothetical protein